MLSRLQRPMRAARLCCWLLGLATSSLPMEPSLAAEVFIICQEGLGPFAYTYALDPDKKVARAVAADGVTRTGDLLATETNYTLRFPAAAGRYAMELRINRISGEMQREFGTAPLFDPKAPIFGNPNVLFLGSCKPTAVLF